MSEAQPQSPTRQLELAGVRIATPEDEVRIRRLREALRGDLFLPGTLEYEGARKVWNGVIDRRPALIVRCAGAADVIASMRFAREEGLPVSVRGGGHNVAGSSIREGGLVIDLSSMRGVRVDPRRRLARVEGGARLGDVDREAQVFGLALPVGVVSRTGIAGLALHGGMGFLTRRYGLTSDNLVAADVVTADGVVVVADEAHHPDLLWALRGGGGNVGVVTSFEFRLHPIGPQVTVGLVLYPITEAAAVIRAFQAFMRTAPDEISGLASLWSAPHEEFVPPEHRGAPVVAVVVCHSGGLHEGEQVVLPLRALGTPIADLSGPMPYVEVQRLFDPEYPDGRRYYWRSLHLPELRDEWIDALIRHAERRPSMLSSIDVLALGGAFGRVDPEQTAFAQRWAAFMLAIEASWDDPADDAANIAWAREVAGELGRLPGAGTYLNFPGFWEDEEGLLRKAFEANYERLREVERRYDPGGVFRRRRAAVDASA